jgi:pyridoxamine 5'-phosphate oxidase
MSPSSTAAEIAALRKSYERAELDESASAADPLQQFDQWLREAIAAQVPEPNAMTLATVGAGGRPSTRVVLIKGYDARGLVWYTNYHSRKGRELAANPHAALQFHWVELERVVRIEGRVEFASAQESDAYYATRPLDSRLGAWASPQSEVISSRALLVANAAKAAVRHGLNPARPPHWGPMRGSSGRGARAGCTTGCAIGSTTVRGCASGSRPDDAARPRRVARIGTTDAASPRSSRCRRGLCDAVEQAVLVVGQRGELALDHHGLDRILDRDLAAHFDQPLRPGGQTEAAGGGHRR